MKMIDADAGVDRSRVILGLLAVGRDMRTILRTSTPETQERRLDAVAGSEFIDDRIRLRE
jgi:hypothetical protein